MKAGHTQQHSLQPGRGHPGEQLLRLTLKYSHCYMLDILHVVSFTSLIPLMRDFDGQIHNPKIRVRVINKLSSQTGLAFMSLRVIPIIRV